MGRYAATTILSTVMVTAAAGVPAAAVGDAAPAACPPGAGSGGWLTRDVPAEVVFGRSLTVTAGVRPEVTDARLELRTQGGTLLAVSTAVAPGAGAGVMRIAGLPAPVGGTRSLTARLSFTAQQGGTACSADDVRTIRLVPGRLGRLRIDSGPGRGALTIRTAAGEGCQDYLRASRVQVRITDPTRPAGGVAVYESTHPCDGWSTLRRARSASALVTPGGANLVLRSGTEDGRLLVTVLRSGRRVAGGTMVVRGGRATFTPGRGAR